jgi:hypothetical protein
MRVLINGRQARGPAAYLIGALAVLLALAILMFVILPIVGTILLVAAAAGAIYLGARALGVTGRRRPTSIGSEEADYRIESSRQLGSRDDGDPQP